MPPIDSQFLVATFYTLLRTWTSFSQDNTAPHSDLLFCCASLFSVRLWQENHTQLATYYLRHDHLNYCLISTKNDLGTSKYVYAALILPLGLSSFNTCFSAHNELAAYYSLSGQAIAKRTSRGFIHLRFARTTSTHIPAIASPTLPLRQQQHLYAIPLQQVN